MKKLFLIISLLILTTINYGHEATTIIPKLVDNNTDNIYIVYKLNNSLPIYNFTLNLGSDSIEFKNNSINMSYIEEYKGICKNFSGRIINKTLNDYDIIVSVKYILNDSLISYIKHFHVYRVNNSEPIINKTKPKYHELNNISNTTNISLNKSADNKSIDNDNYTINITPKNENEPKEKTTEIDSVEPINSSAVESKSSNENQLNYIFYGILGLIFGAIIAVVVLYIYDI